MAECGLPLRQRERIRRKIHTAMKKRNEASTITSRASIAGTATRTGFLYKRAKNRISTRCSCTMRTARSRTSGEYFGVIFLFIMAPFSQRLEPPQNPGRFKSDPFHTATHRQSLFFPMGLWPMIYLPGADAAAEIWRYSGFMT